MTLANNTNNTTVSLTIAKDSGKLVDLKVLATGTNYDTASMVIESPQLPGGTTATGSLGVPPLVKFIIQRYQFLVLDILVLHLL